MKKPLITEISLKVKNNTNLPQPVVMFNSLPNVNASNNNHTLYEFDLSAETFVGITTVQLAYTVIPNPTTLFLISPLTSLTISGVVDVLNSFGLVLFQYSGTTIYAYTDIYNLMNIVTS